MNYTYLAADIKCIKDLDNKSYVANGPNTPLFDYLGRLINETGERLSKIDKQDRPAKVLFVIITDGEENASRTFTKYQVNEMVKHQKEKYNWDFMFIGAGLEMFAAEQSYGEVITAGGISVSSRNTEKGYVSFSNKMSSYRSCSVADKSNSLSFTDEEKSVLQS